MMDSISPSQILPFHVATELILIQPGIDILCPGGCMFRDLPTGAFGRGDKVGEDLSPDGLVIPVPDVPLAGDTIKVKPP